MSHSEIVSAKANGMFARRPSVAIFDTQPLVIEGVLSVMRQALDHAMVGSGHSVDAMMSAIMDAQPDLVIFDPELPGLRDEVFERARFQAPTTRFIALAASRCVSTAARVLKGSVRGYVLKDRPSEDLTSAIRAVLNGGLYVTPTFAAEVIASLHEQRERAVRGPCDKLNRREEQIISLLLKGRQNREIANELGLSERTVKGYMTNLMMKLGVRSRVEVVLTFRQSARSQPSKKYA